MFDQELVWSKTSLGTSYISRSLSHYWLRSPRVNGKLVLQANNWNLSVANTVMDNWRVGAQAPILTIDYADQSDPRIIRAVEIAESDLRGALARALKNRESASLGVSAATAGQSIAMMSKAGQSFTNILFAVEKFYRTTRGKKRLKRFRRLINKGASPTAGMVLEGFFGWAPLLDDIFNAAATLSNPWPTSWLSVKKKWSATALDVRPSQGGTSKVQWSANGHSAYATEVVVSNPNLWIGNKLGLINPIAVAWDLVPWSFLVNMVSNMGQVMGSLTDFAGITLRNSSLTTVKQIRSTSTVTWIQHSNPPQAAGASGANSQNLRNRTVGAPVPSVTPYVRLPNFGVGTAAIVGALMVQNTNRVSRLLGL